MLCMRKHLSSVISHQFTAKTLCSASGFSSRRIGVLLWPLINDLLCSWLTNKNKQNVFNYSFLIGQIQALFVLILQNNMSGREPATSLVWFFVCFQAVSVQKTPSKEIWTQPCAHAYTFFLKIFVSQCLRMPKLFSPYCNNFLNLNFLHMTYENCIFLTLWQIQTVNAIFVVN